MDLEIHGGWSRAEPPLVPVGLKTNTPATWKWPLFPDKPESVTFNNINLRNGGQHSRATKMQDADQPARDADARGCGSLATGAPTSTANTGGCTAHVKYDEHSIAYDYDVSTDDVDSSGSRALAGSDDAFFTDINVLQSTSTMSSSFLAVSSRYLTSTITSITSFLRRTSKTWIGWASLGPEQHQGLPPLFRRPLDLLALRYRCRVWLLWRKHLRQLH